MRRQALVVLLLLLPACAGAGDNGAAGASLADSTTELSATPDSQSPAPTVATPSPTETASSSPTYGLRVSETLTVPGRTWYRFHRCRFAWCRRPAHCGVQHEGRIDHRSRRRAGGSVGQISDPVSGYVAGAFVDTGGADPDVEDCLDVPDSPDSSLPTPRGAETLALQAQYSFSAAGGNSSSRCADVPDPSQPDVWVEGSRARMGRLSTGIWIGFGSVSQASHGTTSSISRSARPSRSLASRWYRRGVFHQLPVS